MWNLTTSIDELILRASAVYFFLLILFRLWGKKHLGELAPFDMLLLLIISEALQNALVGKDMSVSAGMISILTLMFWTVLFSKASFHWRSIEKMFEGTPKVIVRHGRKIEFMLKKQKISDQELEEALRMEGIDEVTKVKEARVETNGKISVVPF